LPEVDIVISLTHTDQHFAQIVEALAPQGQLALIDDPATLDAVPLKRKSISLHWELMFTRSLFQTADMIRQRAAATGGATDRRGVLRTTTGEHYGRISAENLRRAHALLESGKAKGRSCWKGLPAKPGGPRSGRSVTGSPPASWLASPGKATFMQTLHKFLLITNRVPCPMHGKLRSPDRLMVSGPFDNPDRNPRWKTYC
jgi:hypothetical protein